MNDRAARLGDSASLAERWFETRGWQPFEFQRDVWSAMQHDRSGLLHATTGAGKTRLVVWGLSATLGNLSEAMQVLLGEAPGTMVQGRMDKTLIIDTLLPDNPGRFSWGGHLGQQMQMPVVNEIERSQTTLVFVNMRSQAETWYQLLLQQRPEWAGSVALHHGSLDREAREWVELGLKAA